MAFAGFAIVELLGHVRLAGMVTEEEMFGTKMGRIDMEKDGESLTQIFSGSSVYRITPCTQEVVDQINGNIREEVKPLKALPKYDNENDENFDPYCEEQEDDDDPLWDEH